MNKYDYGYDIHKGTTTSIAFDAIKPHSDVLEIGCSNGNLTKHLKEEKNCSVDIIELDEDAGNQAKQYSRNYMLGPELGDVEKDNWFDNYQNNRYDYIVILDVLEHLRNPEKVLLRVKELLNKDGSIIISVPNMAHNSVLIDLINNKVKYNELGILDNTHIRLFTEWTLNNLVRDCGLCAVKKHVIQIPVGSNEIKNTYDDVNIKLQDILKNRYLAEVFQFLYILKTSGKEDEIKYEPLDTTKRIIKIYYKENKESLFNEDNILYKYIKNNENSVEFNISDICPKVLRIDMFYNKCILENVHIKLFSSEKEIVINQYKNNGTKIKNNCFCFTRSPMFVFDVPDNFRAEKVVILFNTVLYADKNIDNVEGYIIDWWGYLGYIEDRVREHENKEKELKNKLELITTENQDLIYMDSVLKDDFEKLKLESESKSLENERLKNEKNELNDYNNELKNINENLKSNVENLNTKTKELKNKVSDISIENEILKKELENIYTSRSWKITCRLRKIKNIFS